MWLYEAFHLVQNSERKLKGVRGCGLRALWKWVTTFIKSLKILTYVMSYTGYVSLVKKLLKFELIKAHLNSLRFF